MTVFKEKIETLRTVAGQGGEQPVIEVQLPVEQGNIQNTWGTFDGNLLKWKSFRVRYYDRIHNNRAKQAVGGWSAENQGSDRTMKNIHWLLYI